MLFHIATLLIVVVLFAGFKSIKKNNRNSTIPLFLTFALFFAIHIFRGTYMGADTHQYYLRYFNSNFDHIFDWRIRIDGDIVWDGEFIFRLFMVWLRETFGEDLFWMNFGVAVVMLPGFYYFIKKNSKNYFLSALFFILSYNFAQSMNITRQYIAVMICLHAFVGLMNKKYLRFILLVFVAQFVHAASLVFMVLLIPAIIKIPRMSTIMTVMTITPFVFLAYFMLEDVLMALNPALLLHDEIEDGNLTAIANFGILLISAISLAIMTKRRAQIKHQYYYYCALIMALVSNVLAFRIHVFSRLTMWFMMVHIIIVPAYMSTKMKKQSELIFRTMIVGYYFFYFYFALSRNSAHVFDATGNFVFRFPWRDN